MGKVIATNISEKKGTQKRNVHTVNVIEDFGIEHDAHAGKWHRQVSLLSHDKIEAFKAKGAPVQEGAFGENLIVQGFDFKELPVGTKLKCNSVVLEMTQIGKECHSGCEIYKIMGDCIMPREGVFARVLKGGTIAEGDEMTIVEDDPDGLRETDGKVMYSPVVTLRLSKDKSFFGPGPKLLLTLIDSIGSVKEASRQMNISYTKAWTILNGAEQQLGYEIVTRQHGGKDGGSCALTPRGKVLLEAYEELEQDVKKMTQEAFNRIFVN